MRENILKELRETFKDNKPDLLLNNPEYLLFCATNKANWQSRFSTRKISFRKKQ